MARSAACVFCVVAHLGADTHYAGGSDLGVYPYITPDTAAFYLQDAIDTAEAGDTVFVLPGLHSGPAGGLRMGAGMALVGSGPSETFIFADVRAANGVRISGFTFVDSGLHGWDFPASGPFSWSVSDCLFDGSWVECIPGGSDDELTVRRCVFKNLWTGTAISAFQYKVSVSDCRFEMTQGAQAVAINVSDSLEVSNCAFTGCASAVYCLEGTTHIENCVFLGNGRGLEVIVASVLVENCTFLSNTNGIRTTDQCDWGPTVRNSISWGSPEANVFVERSDGFGVPRITFSNVEGGYPGRGNIDADPMFFLPSGDEADLHLCAFSPCIDAGDPFSDYSGEPQPNGGRVNMGAYGNTWGATTSELVDMDADNMRDDWEIEHFGDLGPDGLGDADDEGLNDREEYRYLSNPNNADTDGDGLSDREEVLKYRTDPILADTDNDGTPDGKEVGLGTNPLDPWDAFTIIKFWIEDDKIHVVHPVQPRHWFELESSFWPNGPFGGLSSEWQGRWGVTTHTFTADLNPHTQFFRIKARSF